MTEIKQIFASCLLAFGLAAPGGENFVPDGAFDNSGGWIFWNASRDAASGHDSPGSASFRSEDDQTRRMVHRKFDLNQEKPVPLEYGGWCRTEGVLSDRHPFLYLAVSFQDGTEFWKAPSVLFQNKTDWTFRKKNYTPEKPVKSVTLYMEFSKSSGSAWIDDVFLREQTLSPDKPAEPAGPDGNYLENGAFADGNAGWEFWNAGLEKKSGRGGDDSFCALFDSKDDRTRRMIHTDVVLNQKTPMPIVFGGWSRSSGVPADKHGIMYIAVFFQDGTEFWQAPVIKFDNTAEWTRGEQQYLPPKPVKKIHLYMEFNKSPGTVWMDDVFVNMGGSEKAEAFAPCRIQEKSGTISMENAFSELVFAPSRGGACIRFLDKKSGAEFAGTDPDMNMFTDRVRELGRTALFQSNFGYRILKNSPDSVSVEFSLPKLPNYPFAGIRRVVTMERDSAKVKIHYTFSNEPAAMTKVTLTPYFRSGLCVKGESADFFCPVPEGAAVRSNSGGGEARYSNPVQGWSAVCGKSGRGIACEFDLSRVNHIYNWLGGADQSTLEWAFEPLEIANGGTFETDVVWYPFSGMRKIANAENGIAGNFLEKGYEFYSSENLLVTAETTAEYENGKKIVENKSLFLTAGEKKLLPFGFPEKNLKSVRVSLLQNGKSCFESFRTTDPNYQASPRTAKIPPAEIKPFRMELSREVETPHVKWCVPYAGGTVNALVLTNLPNAREIVELMQRMDISCETVRFSDQSWEIGFWHPERYLNFSANDANLSLADALGKEYDVIVVSGGMWKFFSPENIARIAEKLGKGTGLVLIHPSSLPESILPFTPLASKSVSDAGSFSGKDLRLPDLSGAAWPEGRFFRYDFRRDSETLALCRGIPFLVRNAAGNSVLAYAGAGTLVPELPYSVPFPDYNYPDYQFQPLIKSILAAAKKSPSVRMGAFSMDAKSVNFRISGVRPFGPLSAKVLFRNLLSGAYAEKIFSVPDGENVSLPLPGEPGPGWNLADVILSMDGKVLDFGGCAAEMPRPAVISAFSADPEKIYQSGDEISGAVSSTGGKTSVELSDTWGRLLVSTAVSGGRFRLTVPEASSRRMYLTAKTFSEDGKGAVLSDSKRLELYIFKPFADDDFLLTIGDHCWASGRNRYFSTFGFYSRILESGFEHLRFWVSDRHDVFRDALRYNMALTFPVSGSRASGFDEDKRLYNQTKDKKHLCRKPCLHDSSAVESSLSRKHAMLESLKKYSPSGVDFGDENSITAWATPFDYCFSEDTLNAFREWLKTQYPDPAALNREWDSSFPDWESVMPMTSAEILKKAKTTRNYAQWADHRLFMDLSFAEFFAKAAGEVRKYGIRVPLDISGISEPTAYDGMDWWRFSKILNQASFYRLKTNDDVIASFGDVRGTGWDGYGACGDSVKYTVWNDSFRFRRSGAAFYAAEGLFLNPDYSMPRATRDFLDAVKDLRFGVGRLLESLNKSNLQVMIHYSMPSIRTCDLEGRLPELVAARESWMNLLADLNLDYRFVSYEQVEKGEWVRDAKILILPLSAALSGKEAEKIEEFVRNGGLVVADRMTGIFDEHSRLLEHGRLDSLFGLSSPDTADSGMRKISFSGKNFELAAGSPKEVFSIRKSGSGKAVFLNALMTGYSSLRAAPGKVVEAEAYRDVVRALFDGFASASPVRVSVPEGASIRAFHYTSPKNPDVRFVGLLRENRGEAPAEAVLAPDGAKHVYSVRDGKYLGEVSLCKTSIAPADAKLFAFLPYKVREVTMRLPRESVRGEETEYSIRIETDSSAPADHPCVLEVYSPDGKKNLYYSRNLTVENGVFSGKIRFALNDAAGKWTFSVRDVISGKTASAGTVLP